MADDELIRALTEYVQLLEDELSLSAGFLHVHGWTVPEERVQRGRQLRLTIAAQGGASYHD